MRRGSFASRLRRLSWADRALVVEAAAWLALARVAVRTLPLGRLAPRLGRRMAESPFDVRAGEVPRRVAWAVGAAARRTPWRTKCLEQALAGKMMLRRRGVPSTMYLGVAHRPFEAHAWLRVGRDTVLGGRDVERFAVVASFADAEGR